MKGAPSNDLSSDALCSLTEEEYRRHTKAFSRCSFFWVEQCESTMDEARAALLRGDDPPFVLFTSVQTVGRGRNGNSWIQSDGSLAGTFVLSLFSDAASCSGLSLAVGVVVAELFKSLGMQLQLKWPNDLLLQSREKIGGILIEIVERDEQVLPLIGIGLNLGKVPSNTPGAGSLSIAEKIPSIAGRLAAALQEELGSFADEGFAAFRERFYDYAAFLGEEISFSSGGVQQRGVFTGVSEQGALRVTGNDTEAEFHSADSVRPTEGALTNATRV